MTIPRLRDIFRISERFFRLATFIQATIILMRQALILIILATFSLGGFPSGWGLLSDGPNPSKNQSEHPLQDSEEANEKIKAEWDELEVLFCGLLTDEVGHRLAFAIGQVDESVNFSQSVLSSPDHSRAPPVRC